MSKQEEKGGEEAGRNKSVEELGKELLRAAEIGDAARVKELLQCDGVNAQYFAERDVWGGITALFVACERWKWRAFSWRTEGRRRKTWRERSVMHRGEAALMW